MQEQRILDKIPKYTSDKQTVLSKPDITWKMKLNPYLSNFINTSWKCITDLYERLETNSWKKTRELVKIIARISWIGLQYPREQKQEFKY